MSENVFDGIRVGHWLKVRKVLGGNVALDSRDHALVVIERADFVDFIEAFARCSGVVVKVAEVKTK